MLGFAQSGLPGLRVASLTRADHRELAVQARAAAERLLDDDGRARSRAAGPADRSPRELASGWLRRLATADPASGS